MGTGQKLEDIPYQRLMRQRIILKLVEDEAKLSDPSKSTELIELEKVLALQTRLTIRWMNRAVKAERQLRALMQVKSN